MFTWIFLLLMILQGVYYMHHAGEFYSADQTYANAPAILYTVLAGMGYISFIATAIFSATALGKDIEYRTTALMYTTQATEKKFFLGRYLGSLSMLALLCGGYLAGIFLFNLLPVPNLGPFSWPSFARGILLIFIPNLFILYTLAFSLATLTKNPKASYGVALGGMLLMIFAETTFENNQYIVLADPTGFSVLHNILLHLSPAEKNSFSPAFSGLLLFNRLIWVGGAAILFLLAYFKFSFAWFNTTDSGRKMVPQQADNDAALSPGAVFPASFKSVTFDFSLSSRWKKVASLSWMEFKSVTRTTGFKIFLGLILVVYVCYIAMWQQQYYSAAPTLPVTLEITNVTIPLSFYFLLFIVINTADLLFKSQASGFWQISDTLPIPNWVTVLSKILAMVWVCLLLILTVFLLGIAVQAAKGYYHFEPAVYFRNVLVRWLPKYIGYILFTTFIAGITARRYPTIWISVIFLVISSILHELDIIEQHRFNFIFSPGSGLGTDMNGNAMFNTAHGWYMLYWLSLSIALLSVGLWVWQRGTPTALLKRMARQGQFSPAFILLLTGCILVFIFSGRKIYHTVNVLNHFQSKEQVRAEQADYEKKYKRFENYPQPMIRKVNLMMDLFPEKRKLAYTTRLQMQNQSYRNIDTLHIEWNEFSEITQFTVDGYVLKLVQTDIPLRHNIYLLNHPLPPGGLINVEIRGSRQYQGYTNDDPQKDIAANGSFISENIIPFFGYDENRSLIANQYRTRYGLPKLKEYISPVSDSMASRQSYASGQAGKIDYQLQISTDKDQQIVAPGILKDRWQKNNRNYFLFESPFNEVYDLKILSARYAITSDTIRQSNPVITEIYSHPGHPYNRNILAKSTAEALHFLDQLLGRYPYQTLRIAERPRYDDALFVSSNTILLPENHGWIADIRKPEDLDYLRYITTRLIATQYFRQLNISHTQGYTVLTSAIPGYLALIQLEQYYGKNALKQRLEKDKDLYLKGRAKETNAEPALLNADDKALYVSDIKGPLVLYRISKIIGQEALNKAIAMFYKQSLPSTSFISVLDFYTALKTCTPVADWKSVEKLFTDREMFVEGA